MIAAHVWMGDFFCKNTNNLFCFNIQHQSPVMIIFLSGIVTYLLFFKRKSYRKARDLSEKAHESVRMHAYQHKNISKSNVTGENP